MALVGNRLSRPGFLRWLGFFGSVCCAAGGFRIVGGTPDQRIDILGAFVGKK